MFALIEWCEDADVKVEPVYPEFSAGEVRVEVVRDTGLVSMSVPGGENAVKVTHQPTGKFAVAVGKGPLADLQRNALIDLRKQVYP
jgi:protein subunit release factor A